MAKLPAFQFYPGDWMKDPSVRRCSHAARGVWVDMLCLMFECDERGVLINGGCPWSREDVAAAVGGNLDVTLRCIDELVTKGACSIRESDGAFYSRRMVRDEAERAKARDRKREERSREKKSAEQTSSQRQSTRKKGDVPDHSQVCPDDVTPMSQPSSSSISTSNKTPPPLTSADSPNRESARSPAWVEEVEEVLLNEFGVEDLGCLQKAIAAGLIEPAIRELLRYFSEHREANGWGPEVLHYRLSSAKPVLTSEKGWPKPSPEARKQQEQQRRQESRQQSENLHQQKHQSTKEQALQEHLQKLEKQFGAELDALSRSELIKLSRQVKAPIVNQVQQDGHARNPGVRKHLLLKMYDLSIPFRRKTKTTSVR